MTTEQPLFRMLEPNPEQILREKGDPYLATRKKIIHNLIHYVLVDSYKIFRQTRTPYPFVDPCTMRPGSISNSKEFTLHNHALIILLNGELPLNLRKHFRCRLGNRLRKKNLAEVAPDLPELKEYKNQHRFSNHEEFNNLVRHLLPLDYSLLIQKSTNDNSGGPFELTHFHVKIERLMDNALRTMGTDLNYLSRNLYEKGEVFIDLLEKKFFEYFNFYHNAAGRRSAAALAAQLLAREKISSTIFVSSQQTRRMTTLTTHSHTQDISVEQYILLPLGEDILTPLKVWAKKKDLDIRRHFLMDRNPRLKMGLLNARYEHTKAGLPSPDGSLKPSLNPKEKWIRLAEEQLISFNLEQTKSIGCPMVYQRQTHRRKP